MRIEFRPADRGVDLCTVAGRLGHRDVDLKHGVLTVRDSKFGKSTDVLAA